MLLHIDCNLVYLASIFLRVMNCEAHAWLVESIKDVLLINMRDLVIVPGEQVDAVDTRVLLACTHFEGRLGLHRKLTPASTCSSAMIISTRVKVA